MNVSTLDLLYLVIAIAVLWVAGMLTWLLFEAALALRKTNRIITSVHKKVLWLEETIAGIGDRLESSASYIGAITKSGKAIATFLKKRKAMRDWDDEDEDDEPPRRRKKTSRRKR